VIRIERSVRRAFLFLALLALAASAHASYGQMRLEGVALALAFVLVVGYGLLVDGALFAGLFRYRAALVAGTIVAAVLAFFLLSQAASPVERLGFFKEGSELVVTTVASAVFLPFIFVAPFAQYRAMRGGRRWPDWVVAWMAVQVVLLPGFYALAIMDERFAHQERTAGQAEGGEVAAGGLGGILELAAKKHERIWGTGWTYPWALDDTPRDSAWNLGLATGVDGSALIAANAPLGETDRAALQTLMEKLWASYAVPQIRTKLVWDALEPGAFSRQLAPQGVNEGVTVSEEVIPVLVARLETDGAARLCPGGRMMDADRAVLTALVQAKVDLYGEAKRRDAAAALEAKKLDREMSEAPFPYGLIWKALEALGNAYGGQPSPILDWESYRQRVERLCAPSAGSDPPAAG